MCLISVNSIVNGRRNTDSWCSGIAFSRKGKNDSVMSKVWITAGVRLIAGIDDGYQGIRIYTHDQFNVRRVYPGSKFPLTRFVNA